MSNDNNKYIRIIECREEDEGSCNVCKGQFSNYSKVVWKICLIPIGISMRLCPVCKEKFLGEVRKMK